MQRLGLAVVLSALFAATASAQVQGTTSFDAGLRLAVFSPARAFSTSVVGRAAQARLLATEQGRAKEIEARNKTLESRQQELARSASVLGEAVSAQRSREIEKFKIDLDRFIQDAQTELMGVQREVEGEFLTKLRPVLDQVATEKKLLLVMNADAEGVAWVHPTLDITQDIVARLDQAAK